MNMHGQDMLWFNLWKYKIHPKCKSYHVKGLYHVNVDLFILNKNRSQSANTAYKLQILITSCKYSLQAANNDMIRGCKWWSQAAKSRPQAANNNHRLQISISDRLQAANIDYRPANACLQPCEKCLQSFRRPKHLLQMNFDRCELAASLLQACCVLAANTKKRLQPPIFFYWGSVSWVLAV